jgi:hypothetical protein
MREKGVRKIERARQRDRTLAIEVYLFFEILLFFLRGIFSIPLATAIFIGDVHYPCASPF